jgi:hypothetical protein
MTDLSKVPPGAKPAELPQSTVFTDVLPWQRSGLRKRLGDEDCFTIGPDSVAVAFLPIGRDGHAAALRDADVLCRLVNSHGAMLQALTQIADGLSSDPPKLSRAMAGSIARAAIAKVEGRR